ncbi:MAG: hypothetical protein IKS66_07270 [Oscillospiraceae bacterium]|nr:hypothetical protein [Oscillospiraceae bacterium]
MNEFLPAVFFDPNYYTALFTDAMEAQRQHMEQQQTVSQMVKAVTDYFEAFRKLMPGYQQFALQTSFMTFMQQAAITKWEI